MKLIWTSRAKSYLHNIVQYYKEVASAKVAYKIKSEILQSAQKLLIKHPRLGTVEQQLLPHHLRSLIIGNYKIIYLIDEKNIYILDVFDTRQNPSKMGRSLAQEEEEEEEGNEE